MLGAVEESETLYLDDEEMQTLLDGKGLSLDAVSLEAVRLEDLDGPVGRTFSGRYAGCDVSVREQTLHAETGDRLHRILVSKDGIPCDRRLAFAVVDDLAREPIGKDGATSAMAIPMDDGVRKEPVDCVEARTADAAVRAITACGRNLLSERRIGVTGGAGSKVDRARIINETTDSLRERGWDIRPFSEGEAAVAADVWREACGKLPARYAGTVLDRCVGSQDCFVSGVIEHMDPVLLENAYVRDAARPDVHTPQPELRPDIQVSWRPEQDQGFETGM